jgi:hypothetical protein
MDSKIKSKYYSITLPRAYFTFVSSTADETKVTKNQVGANAFLDCWVIPTT